MRTASGRHAFLLIFLCSISVSVFSQVESLDRKALVLVQNLTTDGSQEAIAGILGRRIADRLAAEGIETVVPVETADFPLATDEPRVTRIAGSRVPEEIDLVVGAFYQVEGGFLVIQFLFFDPIVNVALGGLLTRTRAGLAVATAIEEAVAQAEPSLQKFLDANYRREPPQDKVERIFVTGPQEDVEVLFAGLEVGSVRGGRVFVPYSPFPVGTVVPMTLRKDGYHPVLRDVPLDAVENDISLPTLTRASRIGLDLRWSPMLAAGFGITARIYTAPDSSFVAIDHYRLLAPEGSESSAVRTYDIALRFARYFIFDYESRFRMNLSVGAGLIGSDIADRLDPLFYDLYVALGDPHVELRLGGWKLMVRADLHFAVGAGNNLLGRRWILSPVVGLPPVSVGIGRSW